jgi:hypothetical protein
MGNRTWLNIGVGQELQVEIDSRKFWNCGAVWLEESGRYDFEVQGSQRWVDFYKYLDANGYPIPLLQHYSWARRNSQYNWFALVGSIEMGPSTEFLIGTQLLDYPPVRSGRLFCFANDAWFAYWNNWGSLVLTIRRVA